MSTSSQSSAPDASHDTLSQHLNTVFAPLEFPPELARRVLTHLSHKDAKRGGHSARLAFMGRRVLEAYLMLFLHSCPPSKSVSKAPDYATVASRALNTYILGEHVAPHWNLGSVVRWHPTRDSIGTGPNDLRSIGLFKGGSTAHRLFHTRLLPHILLPGKPEGLLDTYHVRAHEVLKQMGGPQGPLAPPS
ncbi:hypothetical protein EWM64_g5705 [Hericium alpestre]|uniref:RNase III domain-containing protein n=1 Tax=Hericium alpestre TaxID=135208 RepID=A0A4Y9ZW66_9AGAM|nr:hypothetical protein EWM64_g5705 [Hericium alpestre]